MEILKGKKILLIVPNFHGYELVIGEEMKRQGLLVSQMNFYGVLKIGLQKNEEESQSIEHFIYKIKETIKQELFDFLLVINLDFIPVEILKEFKIKNTAAKTIFYLWDSLINLGKIKNGNILKQYDYRFSFDFSDCINYPELNIRHRPTFFHPYGASLPTPAKCNFDIASVMSAMPMRLAFLNRLQKFYKNQLSFNFHVHFPSLLTIPAYLINHKVLVKPRFVRWKKITIFQTLDMFNEAKCILDLPYHNQNGLTLRSLDAIGMRKKLITTNKEITRYKFYHPANIMVIPPGKVEDIGAFLKIPMVPLKEEIGFNYSIKCWVQSILLNENIVYAI